MMLMRAIVLVILGWSCTCVQKTVEVNASFALAVVNQNTATAFVDSIATSTVLNQVVMCVAQASDNQS